MAQWDGIGDTERWGEYYAGRRAKPPSSPLMPSTERDAWEWAAAIMVVDKARTERFAAYCQEHGIARVLR